MESARIGGAAVVAVAVTVGLFLFMQYLISGGPKLGDNEDNLGGIRFGPIKLDDELSVKQRRIPKKPPPPKEPPPPPKLQVQDVQKVQSPMPNLNMPKLDISMSGSGPFLGNFAQVDRTAEGDIIPLVRIQPQYPRKAAMNKTEGYVTVEFTITETGSVTNPRVIDSDPPRVFDREAMRAILKWKFKPRIIDGVPVARPATQTLDFKLAE